METKIVKLSEIKPAPYNPRVELTAKDQEYKALDASIEEHGLVLPLIVNLRDNCLIGGHQRLSVLLAEGETETNAVVVDMDEAQAKALCIALNKLDGDWDYGKLAELLQDLIEEQENLASTGFTQKDIDELLGEIGDELGIPSYIVDPVVIDEMTDVARYAGHPLFQRVSIFHALNQKAVAKRFAKEQGKKYEDLNLIVCHMGGGVSIGAHMKGSVVDTQNALDGEGPFSPERSGSLPTGQLVKQCFSGKYTEGEMHRMLSGRGGLVAYTGSNDMRYLLAQAEHDKKIAGVVDAFHYQIGKEIGAMAAVMHGKVDQIILTGGIAYGKETVDAISEMVGWIAPITVYPGEDELLALAQGALRVLKGEEKAQEYRRPRPEDNN